MEISESNQFYHFLKELPSIISFSLFTVGVVMCVASTFFGDHHLEKQEELLGEDAHKIHEWSENLHKVHAKSQQCLQMMKEALIAGGVVILTMGLAITFVRALKSERSVILPTVLCNKGSA